MDFRRTFKVAVGSVIIVLVLLGNWILLQWGFDAVSKDDPPTLKETAQRICEPLVKKFRDLPWEKRKREEVPAFMKD